MALTDRIAETIQHLGDVQAQGALGVAQAQARAQAANGQIWGGTLASLGQIPGEILQGMQQQKYREAQLADMQAQAEERKAIASQRAQQAKDAAAVDTAMQQGGGIREQTIQALVQSGNGHLVPTVQQTFDRADESAAKARELRQKADEADLTYAGHLAAGIKAMNYDPAAAQIAIQHAKEKGYDIGELEQALQANPQALPQIVDGIIAKAQPLIGPKDEAPKVIGDALVSPKGEVLYKGEPKPPAPQRPVEVRTMENGKPVVKFLPPDQVAGQTFAAQPPASVIYPKPDKAADSQDQKDVVESVKGMKDGTVPPILPSRASREYTALMAEAHRQGFDLVKANEDWTATQKYLSTLNGQQQVRLRQAVGFTKESLPLVETLAQQWDAGKFGPLNKARLALAKQGALGQDAQSIATKLDAQIADLTSELGTVYKGGNSSTDESLKLAAQNLNANWSKQTLLDNVQQIRKNLAIRENSIRAGSPVANEGNRYAPATAPAPAAGPPPGAKVRVWNPATGKLE